MKAGTYYVGDLCYVFDDEDWSAICDLMYDNTGNPKDHFINHNGIEMFWSNTMYGDGVYHDQYGHEYPVDAGLIGAVRLEDLTSEKAKDIVKSGLGEIVEFDRDFSCSSEEGIIYIGKYIINTADDEEDPWADDDLDEELEEEFEDDEHGYRQGLLDDKYR